MGRAKGKVMVSKKKKRGRIGKSGRVSGGRGRRAEGGRKQLGEFRRRLNLLFELRRRYRGEFGPPQIEVS